MMLFPGLHLNSHSQYLQDGINLIILCGPFHPGISLCMVRLVSQTENQSTFYCWICLISDTMKQEWKSIEIHPAYSALMKSWTGFCSFFFFSLCLAKVAMEACKPTSICTLVSVLPGTSQRLGWAFSRWQACLQMDGLIHSQPALPLWFLALCGFSWKQNLFIPN